MDGCDYMATWSNNQLWGVCFCTVQWDIDHPERINTWGLYNTSRVYLRRRSRSFRKWVDQIERIHLLTWALRALLLSAACYGVLTQTGDVQAVAWVLVGAVSLAGVLRTVERHV